MAGQRRARRQPESEPPAGSAFESALKALNRRERSVAEVQRWLAQRDFDPEAADTAIARLIESGALDDDRFAHAFAADKRELAGWGEERITAALLDRGIGRDLAEEAGREGYAEQAARAAGLLAERGEELGDDAARNRALGFLTRRGFTFEIAHDAIRDLSHAQR